MPLETHLYDILSVLPTATSDEISKSYRKLALKCHPDKTNRDPQLTEQFKELTRAYEVLRDDSKRKMYDSYGEIALDSSFLPPSAQQVPTRGPSQPQPQSQPPPFPNANDIFSQVFNDINSMFSQAPAFQFGRNFMATGPPNQNNMKKIVEPAGSPLDQQVLISGQDIHHTCSIELGDLYFGKTIRLKLPKNCKCQNCEGYGGFNPRTCRVCRGSGKVIVTFYNQFSHFRQSGACETCNGTGTFVSPMDKCQVCSGVGYKKDSKILNIDILPGTKDGDTIVLKGEADEGRKIIPGNVNIHIKEIPHPFLVRKFNDLYMEHTIDLKTALLGGQILIPNYLKPDHSLRVFINVHGYNSINNSINPSLQSGEVVGTINTGEPKIVKGVGMPINNYLKSNVYLQNFMEDINDKKIKQNPNSYNKGNLFINFNVKLPTINDFANGEADLSILNSILPNTNLPTNENSNDEEIIESHLANISFESPTKANVDTNMEYRGSSSTSIEAEDSFNFDDNARSKKRRNNFDNPLQF
ncbi:hypothetical protein DFJ63DRAFT_322587 [Scheffersomyces coipomensis]|uniref:uncharacterized protein n=1 Tax=Scheffersomyces coipomensis TaxID=1788519 RepID=UPI00315D8BAC